jgi:hypothetical protein
VLVNNPTKIPIRMRVKVMYDTPQGHVEEMGEISQFPPNAIWIWRRIWIDIGGSGCDDKRSWLGGKRYLLQSFGGWNYCDEQK